RLLVGSDSGIEESVDQGNNWLGIGPAAGIAGVGAAQKQGPFTADPGFPLALDLGADTYDPDTIYGLTTASEGFVTKDHGLSWLNRSTGLPGGGLSNIVVDPRNQDIAYVVRAAFGGGKVFMTTTAGRSVNGQPGWVDITGTGGGALPDSPVYSIVVDPRT